MQSEWVNDIHEIADSSKTLTESSKMSQLCKLVSGTSTTEVLAFPASLSHVKQTPSEHDVVRKVCLWNWIMFTSIIWSPRFSQNLLFLGIYHIVQWDEMFDKLIHCNGLVEGLTNKINLTNLWMQSFWYKIQILIDNTCDISDSYDKQCNMT